MECFHHFGSFFSLCVSFVSILSFNYRESCTKITISTVQLICTSFKPKRNRIFFCGPKSYFRILNAINCCHHCMKTQCMRGELPLATTCAIFFPANLSLCVFFLSLSISCNSIEQILMSLNFWLKGQWTFSSVILQMLLTKTTCKAIVPKPPSKMQNSLGDEKKTLRKKHSLN